QVRRQELPHSRSREGSAGGREAYSASAVTDREQIDALLEAAFCSCSRSRRTRTGENGRHAASSPRVTKRVILVTVSPGRQVRLKCISGRGLECAEGSRIPSPGAERYENETRFRFFARRRWVCGATG